MRSAAECVASCQRLCNEQPKRRRGRGVASWAMIDRKSRRRSCCSTSPLPSAQHCDDVAMGAHQAMAAVARRHAEQAALLPKGEAARGKEVAVSCRRCRSSGTEAGCKIVAEADGRRRAARAPEVRCMQALWVPARCGPCCRRRVSAGAPKSSQTRRCRRTATWCHSYAERAELLRELQERRPWRHTPLLFLNFANNSCSAM